MGGRAVNVDVVNVLGLHLCVFQSVEHHELGAETLGMGGRDVVCVGTHAGTGHLGVDLGTASFGVLQLLQDERHCALTHHETVARSAEGTRSALGIVIAGGEGVHRAEAAHTGTGDGCFGTAAHDDVGLAQTNQVEGGHKPKR